MSHDLITTGEESGLPDFLRLPHGRRRQVDEKEDPLGLRLPPRKEAQGNLKGTHGTNRSR